MQRDGDGIGSDAFYGCTNLTEVISLNPTPPTCSSTTFDGLEISTVTLIVANGSSDTYDSAAVWKGFGTIVEESALGVKLTPTSENEQEVVRYTQDGKRISSPQRGVNIIRYSDGTVRKVLVE